MRGKIMTDKELYALASAARSAAYAPYSGISVGAALLTVDGRVYSGANIENSAYSPSVCAERVAFFSAIASGERKFSAIAVAGGALGEPERESFPPCGVCRQVMREFCNDDFRIILSGEKSFTLGEILPESFGGEHIK